MDKDSISNKDEDKDIRNPDPIIRETLLTNNIFDNYFESNSDDEYNRIIEFSKIEFERQNDIQEQELTKLMKEEKDERLQKFVKVKQTITKLSSIDKKNAQIYETILTVIQMYEECIITIYELTADEHERFFTLLKTIRLTKQELDSLRHLLVCFN
jgi:hypothetical protein